MSGPTKIYLAIVAVLVIAWVGVSTLVAERKSGPRFITDPNYMVDHSDRFGAMLRGRVDVRDADGQPVAPPEGTLVIDVQARDAGGTMAVRRIGTVQSDGVFEILGLPHGLATVAVQLGGGQTIWQRDDIVVGGVGTLDPRIDPIDLGDELFSFDLEVRAPGGEPATRGQLAWRMVGAGLAEDVLAFDGIAPINGEGRARFLTTADVIDAVCFVPGARTELYEELYSDSRIDLGPGTSVEIVAEGTLPDPERWTVEAALSPIELFPKVEVNRDGLEVPALALRGVLEDGTSSVIVPVARGGQYRLIWRVYGKRRQRFNTIRLPDETEVAVSSEPGMVRITRAFPIDAFLGKVPGAR